MSPASASTNAAYAGSLESADTTSSIVSKILACMYVLAATTSLSCVVRFAKLASPERSTVLALIEP